MVPAQPHGHGRRSAGAPQAGRGGRVTAVRRPPSGGPGRGHRRDPRLALATVRPVVTAPLDAATGERLRAALDARVVEAYGPAAAAGVALANPPTADARPGTAGLTVPRTRARIAVEGFPDVDVLPDHAGELLLRGPQIGDHPGRTAGSWLRTGLLAVRGPDGFVTLLRDGDGQDAAAPPH
ncbi:AMP-binding protein [Streptomyces althioticus]|uniref:AMP-binding protein n=1 Tax=Streptomyces althioticus TaxID=83380 RepID=UPI0036F817F4